MTAATAPMRTGPVVEDIVSARARVPGMFERYFMRLVVVYAFGYIGFRVLGSLALPYWDKIWLEWLAWPGEQVFTFILGKYWMHTRMWETAPFIALLWYLVERGYRHHEKMRDIATLLLRYSLAGKMLGYAIVKVPATSWPAGLGRPAVESVYALLGDVDAGLLFWWWNGVAPTYAWFTAAVEIFGALLLLSRRTATTGFVLSAFALVNIALMMQSYRADAGILQTVPADGLTIVCLLLWLERERLSAFFIRDSARIPGTSRLEWASPTVRKVILALQVMWCVRTAYVLFDACTSMFMGQYRPLQWSFYRLSTDGLYRVTRFERRGGERTAAQESATAWRHVVLMRCDAYARTVEDRQVLFYVSRAPSPDSSQTPACNALGSEPDGHTLQRLGFGFGPPPKDTIWYARPAPGRLTMTGRHGADTIAMELERIPDEQFPLYSPRWWKVRDNVNPPRN